MEKNLYQIEAFSEALKKAKSVLLISHVSPDGDTVGSAMALKFRLERMGCRAALAVDGIINEKYAFLPQVDSFLKQPLREEAFDTAIAVDVASIDRLGSFRPVFETCPLRMVIDHHATNPGYGDINLIDGDAPATAVVLFRVFSQMELPLSQEESICLYTALATDTGNFIYPYTTAEAFRMAAALLEAGLPLNRCARKLFQEMSASFVRLLGIVLGSGRSLAEGRLVGYRILQRDMAEAGADDSQRDGIVNYGIDIRGTAIAYAAFEMPDGKTKFSLRSVVPYDVASVAKRLGGGGHEQAAGLTLNLPMDEAVPLMEAELLKVLEEAKA